MKLKVGDIVERIGQSGPNKPVYVVVRLIDFETVTIARLDTEGIISHCRAVANLSKMVTLNEKGLILMYRRKETKKRLERKKALKTKGEVIHTKYPPQSYQKALSLACKLTGRKPIKPKTGVIVGRPKPAEPITDEAGNERSDPAAVEKARKKADIQVYDPPDIDDDF